MLHVFSLHCIVYRRARLCFHCYFSREVPLFVNVSFAHGDPWPSPWRYVAGLLLLLMHKVLRPLLMWLEHASDQGLGLPFDQDVLLRFVLHWDIVTWRSKGGVSSGWHIVEEANGISVYATRIIQCFGHYISIAYPRVKQRSRHYWNAEGFSIRFHHEPEIKRLRMQACSKSDSH